MTETLESQPQVINSSNALRKTTNTFSKKHNPSLSTYFPKVLIIVTFSLLLAVDVYGQSASQDSIKLIIQEQVENEVNEQLTWLKTIFGITVGTISILGIYLWVWKIKQTAEKVIEKKADKLIEDQLADKLGVKSELIKSYFQEIERAQELKQKRILVVNKHVGKKTTLEKAIEKAGFTTTPIFKKWTEVENGIDTNKYDLLLIDNEDGSLTEEEITNLVKKYSQSLKFACFTSVDISPESYKLLNGVVRFAKDINYVGGTIENALKS